MIVFRCTKRLVERMKLPLPPGPPRSSGLLGDRYAHVLNIGRARYVLCLSERTLLPVIVHARKDGFPSAFPEALDLMLEQIAIDRADRERELSHCREVLYAPTRSRVLLGAMNDFGFNALVRAHLPTLPSAPTPLQMATSLSRMPSKPIGYDSPDRVVRELFAAATSH
jgi:hypothetical protein